MIVTSKTHQEVCKTPKEIVEDKLQKAALVYYPENTTGFKDFNHFIDSLKCIYGIIANATAEQMIKNIGDDYFYFSSFYKDFITDMKPVNIGYKQFAKSLPRIYKDGKRNFLHFSDDHFADAKLLAMTGGLRL